MPGGGGLALPGMGTGGTRGVMRGVPASVRGVAALAERQAVVNALARAWREGRVAPPVSPRTAAATAGLSPKSAAAAKKRLGRSSAWNQAGTWEERDTTAWCKARLTALVQGVSVDAGGGERQQAGDGDCTRCAEIATSTDSCCCDC